MTVPDEYTHSLLAMFFEAQLFVDNDRAVKHLDIKLM